MLKNCLLFSLGLLSLNSFSQNSGSNCDPVKMVPVKAHFDGYSYKYIDNGIECFRMERAYFQKDFRLSLSDSSYRIIKFSVVTDLADGSLLQLTGDNEGIKIGSDDYTKKLKEMPKRAMVTVDNIVVSKNGECFKVPSFICYLLQ